MVFTGVQLPEDTAHAGLIPANADEQIFGDKAYLRQFVDDLYVREPLLVGAHFILAFHNVNAVGLQHATSLVRAPEVKVENSLVIFLPSVLSGIVIIVLLEVLMVLMGRPSGRVPVWRIKNNAIESRIAARKVPAVHALAQVSWA